MKLVEGRRSHPNAPSSLPNTADVMRLLKHYGDNSAKFYSKYIQPHWKAWTSTGLLAWYLVEPESFMDATGALTENGGRLIMETAGAATGGLIIGIGGGFTYFLSQVMESFEAQGVNGFFGISLLLMLSMLIFRRVRYYAGKPFRWLNSSPRDK